MHVQRAGEGTDIVRVVKDNGSLIPIEECEAVRRAAAEMALDRIGSTADSLDSSSSITGYGCLSTASTTSLFI